MDPGELRGVRTFTEMFEQRLSVLKSGRFTRREILYRGAHLIFAPVAIMTSTIEAVIAVFFKIIAYCQYNEYRSQYSDSALFGFFRILKVPYRCILKALNPSAKVVGQSELSAKINDWLAYQIFCPLQRRAAIYMEQGFFKRQIASRLTYALLLVAHVVTNIIRTAIGTFAAALSLMTFGCCKSLNLFALKEFPRVFHLKGTITSLCGVIYPE